jgi:hypothetical protein
MLGRILFLQIIQYDIKKQIFQETVVNGLKLTVDPINRISNMHTKARGCIFSD